MLSRFFGREKPLFADSATPAGFRKLLEQLRSCAERPQGETVEAVRQVAEVLVASEQREDDLFEIFCEQEGMKSLCDLYINDETDTSIQIQILQTLN